MSIEKEVEYLENALANGEISVQEFNDEMKEIQRSYREQAEEAAQQAYDDVLGQY